MVGLNAPSKITDLNNVSIFYQDVFRLDVPVNETLLVHVIDAGTDLDEKVKSSVFA